MVIIIYKFLFGFRKMYFKSWLILLFTGFVFCISLLSFPLLTSLYPAYALSQLAISYATVFSLQKVHKPLQNLQVFISATWLYDQKAAGVNTGFPLDLVEFGFKFYTECYVRFVFNKNHSSSLFLWFMCKNVKINLLHLFI